jgi:hypothetical protein
MHDGGIQWGDVGTWFAGLGTWAVGVFAALIAVRQYRQSSFRPFVKAFSDGDNRLVVQVINEASGNGLVQEVDLLEPGHPRDALRLYFWEIDGKKDDRQRPVPFALPGQASAQLVLLPENANLDGIRIRVDYGNGKDSGCVKIINTPGHILGTTHIPNPEAR